MIYVFADYNLFMNSRHPNWNSFVNSCSKIYIPTYIGLFHIKSDNLKKGLVTIEWEQNSVLYQIIDIGAGI